MWPSWAALTRGESPWLQEAQTCCISDVGSDLCELLGELDCDLEKV